MLAAPFVMITKAIAGSWGRVLLFALGFAWTIWWLWDNRQWQRNTVELEQEQLAAQWPNAKVLEVPVNTNEQVVAVKALRATDPRLSLVTDSQLVRAQNKRPATAPRSAPTSALSAFHAHGESGAPSITVDQCRGTAGPIESETSYL
ncbi:MAG: hypothetical protein ACRDUS_04480 [Mycobacterium sp.]